MTLVVSRIVNDFSYVMRVNHEIHFAWQAQLDEIYVSLFVAGAAFGEVHVLLFVAGEAFGEMWNDSRTGKGCNFQLNLLLASAKSNLGGAAIAALPRLQPMYRDLRCPAVRTLLRAARCLRRIRPS